MIASTQTNHPLAGYSLVRDGGMTGDARDEICAKLRAAGLRSTQPRIAIYKVLTELAEPATIDQIYRSIKNASCDLVTVYRGLALFEELGLVHRSFTNNGTALYQLKRDGAPCYYVVCKATGQREAIDGGQASELYALLTRVEAALAERGYKNVSHRLEFQGSHETPSSPESIASNRRAFGEVLN